MSFVGVDGCRAGWVAASREGAVRVHATLGDVLDAHPQGILAVDMPIGLLDAPAPGGRDADRQARALLGPRRASVFSPPARGVLHAARFADAGGLSIQGYNILPRIREVDAHLTPALQGRVVEAHPELAFARMAGAPLAHPKRSAKGRAARERLLRRLPGFRRALSPGWRPPRGAAADDVLDAMALATTAERVADGRAQRVPAQPPVDARGLRMEIWW